ncbi:MAG: hypothetical protein ACLPN1_11575 [Dissulfurispiraceae bacterium]
MEKNSFRSILQPLPADSVVPHPSVGICGVGEPEGTDKCPEEIDVDEFGLFSDVPAALPSVSTKSSGRTSGAKLDVATIAIKPNKKGIMK